MPIVIQRREWEAAHDRAAIARNFYPARDYTGLGGRLQLVDGDHDLLGDGRFPVFADDHAAQRRSAERLRELREAGLTVHPGHDPAFLSPGPIPLAGQDSP